MRWRMKLVMLPLSLVGHDIIGSTIKANSIILIVLANHGSVVGVEAPDNCLCAYINTRT